MNAAARELSPKANARFDYLLRLGDTSLVLAQRLGEWVGHAPAIEEDLGLANLALDLLGQARLLLSLAGRIEGRGRDEDALAFLRTEGEFRNLTLVELPNGDFGQTIARQFLLDVYQDLLYEHLAKGADAELAAIAAKAMKETRYHLRYSSSWLIRLGDGTAESHAKVQAALEVLWPYTLEMFAPDALDQERHGAGVAPDLAKMHAAWKQRVAETLALASLTPPNDRFYAWFGKQGAHSEHLGVLLTEMQYMQRAYPGAKW